MAESENYDLNAEAKEEYDKAVQAINDFTELHEVRRVIRWMLAQCSHIPNEDKFANVTAVMASFSRAANDLEAVMVLCQVHCYPQALGTLRSVYEAAGIGRTMALSSSIKIADDWISGKWQPDSKARQFVRNVMYAEADVPEKDAAVDSYLQAYKLLSKWAHITVDSALTPYVRDTQDGYTFVQTPQFDQDFLKFALNITFVFHIYFAYAVRNSVAPDEGTSPAWDDAIKTLEYFKARLTVVYFPKIQTYDAEMELRRIELVQSIRNSSEFRKHLRRRV
ncbi:MAG: hypothetical protein L0I94_08435 [Yaniella sp.]|nr:hypothetical protein [Yaniella sp.]